MRDEKAAGIWREAAESTAGFLDCARWTFRRTYGAQPTTTQPARSSRHKIKRSPPKSTDVNLGNTPTERFPTSRKGVPLTPHKMSHSSGSSHSVRVEPHLPPLLDLFELLAVVRVPFLGMLRLVPRLPKCCSSAPSWVARAREKKARTHLVLVRVHLVPLLDPGLLLRHRRFRRWRRLEVRVQARDLDAARQARRAVAPQRLLLHHAREACFLGQ